MRTLSAVETMLETVKPGFHYPSWRPELTARVDGWPVSITRQHWPCWRARVSTSRVDGWVMYMATTFVYGSGCMSEGSAHLDPGRSPYSKGQGPNPLQEGTRDPGQSALKLKASAQISPYFVLQRCSVMLYVVVLLKLWAYCLGLNWDF